MEKRRFLAVLLSVVLVVCSSVPAVASELGSEDGVITAETVSGEPGVTEPLETDIQGDTVSQENAEADSSIASDNKVPLNEDAPEGDAEIYAELTSSTNAEEKVSGNAVISPDLYASSGVQSKPSLLSGNGIEGTRFGMVKGQKWYAGIGAVTSDKSMSL